MFTQTIVYCGAWRAMICLMLLILRGGSTAAQESHLYAIPDLRLAIDLSPLKSALYGLGGLRYRGWVNIQNGCGEPDGWIWISRNPELRQRAWLHTFDGRNGIDLRLDTQFSYKIDGQGLCNIQDDISANLSTCCHALRGRSDFYLTGRLTKWIWDFDFPLTVPLPVEISERNRFVINNEPRRKDSWSELDFGKLEGENWVSDGLARDVPIYASMAGVPVEPNLGGDLQLPASLSDEDLAPKERTSAIPSVNGATHGSSRSGLPTQSLPPTLLVDLTVGTDFRPVETTSKESAVQKFMEWIPNWEERNVGVAIGIDALGFARENERRGYFGNLLPARLRGEHEYRLLFFWKRRISYDIILDGANANFVDAKDDKDSRVRVTISTTRAKLKDGSLDSASGKTRTLKKLDIQLTFGLPKVEKTTGSLIFPVERFTGRIRTKRLIFPIWIPTTVASKVFNNGSLNIFRLPRQIPFNLPDCINLDTPLVRPRIPCSQTGTTPGYLSLDTPEKHLILETDWDSLLFRKRESRWEVGVTYKLTPR